MTEPFPFVVGSGRSGTTLLRAILAANPVLSVPPESYVLERLLGVRRRLERDGRLDAPAFLRELDEDVRFRQWGLPTSAVADELAAGGPTDLAGGVRAVYAAYAHAEGRTRWADKTPLYVLSVLPLADLLPEAVFVHLVRDGRDVATSYLGVPFGPRTLLGAAARWRRHVQAGRAAGSVLGPGRYLEVRYEDLVADPEPVVRAICDLAGLTWDPAMLDHSARAEQLLANTAHRSHVSGMTQPLTPGMRDWRTELSEHDQGVVWAVAGDVLAELGYEPGHRLAPGEERRVRAAGRAVGAAQAGSERAKRTRLAMVARPAVRRAKAALGADLG